MLERISSLDDVWSCFISFVWIFTSEIAAVTHALTDSAQEEMSENKISCGGTKNQCRNAPSLSCSYLVLSRSAILILIISQRSSYRRNHVLFNWQNQNSYTQACGQFQKCLPQTFFWSQLLWNLNNWYMEWRRGRGKKLPALVMLIWRF